MRYDMIILGTRPEIIKLAPIILKKELDLVVVSTGQHDKLAKDAFDAFGIGPHGDLKLMKENQDLFEFVISANERLQTIVKEIKPKRIIVQGDTMSALCGAMIGRMNNIPVVHIEAGLRTGDKKNPYPEEIIRVVIDNMSEYLFAPTKRAVENLKKEGITNNVFLVGNTVVDSVNIIKDKLPDEPPIKEKYVLATIHRRESFGNDAKEIFYALKKLSKDIKVILPLHPNPNVRKAAQEVGIDYVEPMDYKTFLWHMKFCEYGVFDSGGNSEEAVCFGKKVCIVRKKTERPEIMEYGYGILADKMDRNFIYQKIKELEAMKVVFGENPFGDGNASDKILKILYNNE